MRPFGRRGFFEFLHAHCIGILSIRKPLHPFMLTIESFAGGLVGVVWAVSVEEGS